MSDWSPLASGDPVPGDPGAVATLARRLGTTAEVVRTQADRLAGIDPGCWEGEAASEFRTRQGELAPKLGTVAERYAKASSALDRYHPDLHQAQTTARRALAEARQAEAAIHGARQGMADMAAHAAAAERAAAAANAADPEAPPASPTPWSGPDHHARLGAAQAEMEAARRLLRQAEELRDGAATTCARSIRTASDDGLVNEGGVFGFFKRAASAINDALPLVTQILTMATAVVGVLSILFPPLAVVAVALGALVLVLDLVLVLTERGSWVDVGLDVLGLATFGLGRAFGAAARAGRTAAASGPKVAKAHHALRAVKSHERGMALARAEWRLQSRGRVSRALRPGQVRRAIQDQDFERIARAERILDEARVPLRSPHLAPGRSLPNAASIRQGFSPSGVWRDSREAFTLMRERGVVNTARGSLTELGDMARGAGGYGAHGQMAARLAAAGTGIGGVQLVKAGIGAAR